MQFTHRLNTTNKERTIDRDKILKSLWHSLMEYNIEKGEKIKVTYWPADLAIPHSLSSFGIKLLEKHVISRRSLSDLNMEEIICPLNDETAKIIFHEENDNYGKALISNWFKIEIVDKEGRSILYSEDFGDNLLVSLSKNDVVRLNEMGFCVDFLITLPEPIPK